MMICRYALAAILLSPPAYAEWTAQQYSKEVTDCAAACDKNNPTRHDTCVAGCRCVMNAAKTQFPDHDQLQREVVEQKLPNRVATFQMIVDTCNRQTFGGPAKKLDIK